MSGDREARILAACETVDVDGKEYRLRPVAVQHLCDLEYEALRYYKRQYLQTFSDNADMLGDKEHAQKLLEERMMEAAGWGLQDLPQIDAFDCSRVPITRQSKKWLKNTYGDVPETDVGVRALLSDALDNKRLSPDELKKMAGKGPMRGRIRYDQWWVTASMEGRISFIVSSIRMEHPEVTKKQIASWPFAAVAEASRKVESVTTASMGNM